MKRILALMLALVMALSLCACGEAKETEEKQPETTEGVLTEQQGDSVWTIQKTVDEFGDVTADSETVVCSTFEGDFSNTATSSSKLTGVLFMTIGGNGYQYNFTEIAGVTYHQTVEGDYPLFTIRLLEYGNTKATYFSSDSISIKSKIDEKVTDYELVVSTPPNGDLTVIDTEQTIYNALYAGKDVKFVVSIGSSKFNFVIKASNFSAQADILTQEIEVKEQQRQERLEAEAAAKAEYEQSDAYKEDIYQEALELMNTQGKYKKAGELLVTILEYKDSGDLFTQCYVKSSYTKWPEDLPQNFVEVTGEELSAIIVGTWQNGGSDEPYVFSADGKVDVGKNTVIGHEGERVIHDWHIEGDILFVGDIQYFVKKPFDGALIFYYELNPYNESINGTVAKTLWREN